MFPFEFVIPGPPVSQQTRNRARLREWRRVVRRAAAAEWPAVTPPEACDLEVRMTYYYDGAAPDVNNIIKPIQDAPIGLVYIDDAQVVSTSSRKRDINGSFRVRGISEAVAQAFVAGTDFLHVKIMIPDDLEDID